jgi:F0F1-type ATP synthase membrane subunit b/b'
MELFQEIYIKILESNLINFIIMVWLLALIFKKAKLEKVFDNMAQDIKEKVQTTREAAESVLKDYEAAKEDAAQVPQIEKEILKKANVTAQAFEEKGEEELRKNLDSIASNLKKTLENVSERFKEETVEEFYSNALDLTQDYVIQNLDEKTHKYLIEKAIEKLERVEV